MAFERSHAVKLGLALHSSKSLYVLIKFEDIMIFRFTFRKFCNRLIYFLYVEVWVVSQYICMSMMATLRLGLSLYFFIKEIFEVLLFCVKSFNFALLPIQYAMNDVKGLLHDLQGVNKEYSDSRMP